MCLVARATVVGTLIGVSLGAATTVIAHPGGHGPQVQAPGPRPPSRAASQTAQTAGEAPPIHGHFAPFDESLGLRWDNRFYYVESDGLPSHPLMIGITAWQQQVPLPQDYSGSNAWRIPLQPTPAKSPLSAKTHFFRGAIALAVNGVPIFNPIKNDGRTDTFLAGELDQWGGHCGRADDYHYHLAPVHLEKVVGEGKPIAYALDGYPIYGYQDERSPDFGPLDEFNGHQDSAGRYHYHATKTYPYLNGGFHGEVVERDGQVDPQPRAQGPRPALPPLRGAKITGFQRSEDGNRYEVVYELGGERRAVRYVIDDDVSLRFTFDNGSDGTREQSYRLTPPGERRGAERPPGDRAPGGRGPGNRTPENGRPADRPARPRREPSARPPQGAARPGDARPEGAAGDAPRRPWIEVHGAELDADRDGTLTAEEVRAEAVRVFAAYDSDGDGRVLLTELSQGRPVRSAMGGFVREHREELDRDRDGSLSRDEVVQNAERMFTKADTDGDGRVAVAASTRPAPPPRREGAPRSPAPPSADATRPQTKPAQEDGASSDARTRPTNIVFILVDDMGWRDVGFAGNTFVETPHIDRLASEGIQFTQAYASAPNCAPTRACLLSGQYTPRHGVYTVIDPRHDPGQPHHRILSAPSQESLDPSVVTIAELLRGRGYATACFGMWNLGRGRDGPTTATGQGFDIHRRPQDLGFPQDAYFDAEGRYLTDSLFQEGLRFIERHRDEPFFLYLPTHAVHAPFDPPPELVEKYRERSSQLGDAVTDADPIYAATIEAVDRNVGRLLAHLGHLGLDDHTLVVFTSDNGGTPQHVAPLNGSKGAIYEGGLRVPCAVWWAGIESPGRTCEEPVLSMDFYPTLAALAGAPLPEGQPIDGIDLSPILRGTGRIERDAVYWHFPCYIGRGEPASAIRAGDWKLIEKFADPSLELYDLRHDPGEARNLAETEPERARLLHQRLTQWQAELHAPRPSAPNPAFDPASRPRGGGRSPR